MPKRKMEPSESKGSAFNCDGDRLLTISEAAELLRISPLSLYHWAADGRVPCLRLSKRCLRFSLRAIREWLVGQDVPASSGKRG